MEVAVSVWYIPRCTRTLSAQIAAGRAGCLQWYCHITMSSGSSGLGWLAQTASPELWVCKPRKGEKLPNPLKEVNLLSSITYPQWNSSEDVLKERERSSAEDLKCRHYFWKVFFGFSFPKVTSERSLGKGKKEKIKNKSALDFGKCNLW